LAPVPYFIEPLATEDRPDFEAVPADIVPQLENIIGGKIISASTLSGGFSPTACFQLARQDGRVFFCKGAHPQDVSHATQNIRQEILLYKNIPELATFSPAYHGYVADGDEDGWFLGLWNYIEPAVIDSQTEIHRAFSLLSQLQKITANDKMTRVDTVPYFQGFLSAEKKWKRFQDSDHAEKFCTLFENRSAAKQWLQKSLPILMEHQDRIKQMTGPAGFFHGDLRGDNILHARECSYIIDWANGGFGPQAFDTVFLCCHLSAMTGISFDHLWQQAESLGCAIADKTALLAAISGYFADQAYRPIPERLPRLRWMQKSMLRAALLGLSEEHLLPAPPIFLR